MNETLIIAGAIIVYIIGATIQFVVASRAHSDAALVVILTPFWPITVAVIIAVAPLFFIVHYAYALAKKLGAVDYPNSIPSH